MQQRYGLKSFSDILKENGIQWNTESFGDTGRN